MNETNQSKFIHGQEARYSIQTILKQCVAEGIIDKFEQNKKFGYDGKEKQFQVPFHVILNDGQLHLLIYSTTSLRADRIKIHQWDIWNCKHIIFRPTKAIVVYPSSIPKKELEGFQSYRDKILNERIYSPIDDFISENHLESYIRRNLYESKSNAVLVNITGSSFEMDVKRILTSEKNLEKYKNKGSLITGDSYNLYCKMIRCLGLDLSKVKVIYPITTIGKLPSKGLPKTDVALKIVYSDSKEELITISCKSSDSRYVSVHQYPVQSFIEALKISPDCPLANLLKKFQEVGGIKALGVNDAEKLTKELKPYVNQLTLWVYGGDSPNPIQNAMFLFGRYENDENKFMYSFHKLEEVLTLPLNGQFGTPFKWTYASGEKGKSIQLKGPYYWD